jgi:heme exporter protein A
LTARLVLDGVTCVRGQRMLFADMSLALGPGEAAVVTGANGVGKSSLIRIAAGLLAPAAGRVERDGELALMTDAAALDGELSLAHALAYWGGDVISALAAVGLTEIADVPVRWLSTGQRKRASLARVIAGNAPIWLLDEPANGLDTASVTMLEALVAKHRAGGGIALVATHIGLAVPDAREIAL